RFVNDLEAIGVAGIVPEHDVMFQEKLVVLAAIEKDQTILQQFVKRSELFTEESTARLGDDVFFDVDEDLSHELADQPNDVAPRGLHFGDARFYDVGLLATLEVFAALADVLLGVQHDAGKLILELAGQQFENGQSEQNVNFDILLVFGAGQ